MRQHAEIGGSIPSHGQRRFLYHFLIRPFPKEKRREARPNEIGLSDFLYQDFQHENDMRKGKQSHNRTKKSAMWRQYAVGSESPIRTYPLRGGRRTAEGPVCEKNRTLVGNCLTCCMRFCISKPSNAGVGSHRHIAQWIE